MKEGDTPQDVNKVQSEIKQELSCIVNSDDRGTPTIMDPPDQYYKYVQETNGNGTQQLATQNVNGAMLDT